VADSSMDWDWDSFEVGAPAPCLLDPYGELQPVAVDESLTSLLFTPSSRRRGAEPTPWAAVRPPELVERAAVERIVRPPCARETSTDLQGALFERV